jgi:integrase
VRPSFVDLTRACCNDRRVRWNSSAWSARARSSAVRRPRTTDWSSQRSRRARGGYLDLHNFRRRAWRPAQFAARIEPLRRPYDLRHTFATFALRAGISTFDLSRFMGASLTMIDRHYGHLARDGREHAAALLDSLAGEETAAAAWTFGGRPR